MGRHWVFLISTLLLSGTDAGAAQSNIPFRLLGEHLIVVRGSLGDLTDRNLVIDTGAYPSIIDSSVAHKLHISGHREELDAVNHKMSRPVVIVPSIEVGPIRAQALRVMTADLSDASQAFGMRIDALIGLDVLQRMSFRVDYRAKRIFFGEFEPVPCSVPFEWTGGMLTVDLQSDSNRLRMLVDTGAQSTLLLGSHLGLTGRGSSREFTNLGGNFRLREVTLKEVQLGDSDLGSQAVYVADSSHPPDYPFDGFLSTIQFEQIAFDFERHRFSWSTRKALNRTVHLAQRGTKAATMLSALSAGLSDAESAGLGRVP
jgi:predicted aspartyl protease